MLMVLVVPLLFVAIFSQPVIGRRSTGSLNQPPVIHVDRDWKVPVDKKVGELVKRVLASDRDGDQLVFSIRPLKHLDGSHLFHMDNKTGVVYLAADISQMAGEQFYLQVAVWDGRHLTTKDIWVEIVSADWQSFSGGGGAGSRPKLPDPGHVHWQQPGLPPLEYFTTSSSISSSSSSSSSTSSTVSTPTSSEHSQQITDKPSSTETAEEVGTEAPTAGREGGGAAGVILAPVLVLVLLLPAIGYLVYRGNQHCRLRKNSLVDNAYSMEFQKRKSLGSAGTGVDKMASETSRTWQFSDNQRAANKALELNQSIGSLSQSSADGVECAGAVAGVRDSWEFPRQQLRVVSQLGEGCFGQVWKCEALNIAGVEGVSTVAVKMLKESAVDREKTDLLQELFVMKLLEPHPNVVTLLGCCTEKEPVFVIMEYVSGGKLQSFLRESRSPLEYNNLHGSSSTLNSRDLTTFSYQIARGMHFLSEKAIIHRDLAARNVLISADRVCKVADFGFARDIVGTHVYERKTEGRLPIRWMAPESLYDNIFTVKSDVWSFGILLWEIVTLGSTPYPGMSAQEVMKKVRDGYRLEKPQHCRRELFNLMYYCWTCDPASRPTFADIVESLEKLLLSDLDYIELDRFPEHSYYNLTAVSDEKV